MLRLDDTIAAIATPPGEGAIGVVRLSGPEAASIARRLFQPRRQGNRRAARVWQPRRVYHGYIVDPASGSLVDEVLLAYFQAPQSYTGQDVVEISGHGGGVGVREILRLSVHAGARPAERGEMTLRAFLAGKMDLAQAEAVADAVRARTPAALSLAVQQLSGSLSSSVSRVRSNLMQVYAHLEATIDFAEDDVPSPAKAELLGPLQQAREEIDALLSTARAGALYREGIRIALVGRPNAGKSSLLNALLQADRAIVTPIAGTTRDVIEESVDLEGVPAVIADTAGITETADPVEQIGVARSRAALAAADVVVLVLDQSRPLQAEDREVVDELVARRNGGGEPAESRPSVVALTKADLPAAFDRASVEQLLPGWDLEEVSSITGKGLQALRRALKEAAGAALTAASGNQAQAVVSNARHREALERARVSLMEAIGSVEHDLPADFICIDLRAAIQTLGEITGESVTDDLLTTIFSHFCIGK
ncbi:MAG TPA: tRNA uridine-5-carboxymethylaminomethyl(34) synthesis GTPase MnmE [Chloroflexota bacterium]|nr:tRNA uridine-5-carboxymethylaminomethyl(34) synthesis GTPase MnmE [Chloroflexota bacterium]